jgi:hypothetical protein
MSYRALPPIRDYHVFADETTLVYANDELRVHERVLIPAADHGSYDATAIDCQNTDFFASILSEREPVSSARTVRPAMTAFQAAQDQIDRQDPRTGSE